MTCANAFDKQMLKIQMTLKAIFETEFQFDCHGNCVR